MKRLIFISLSFTALLLAFTSVYGDHFEVVYDQGTNHSLEIENAFINDQPLEEQDEIGIFTPGGICAGVVVVTDEGAPFGVAVYGDNPESEELDGFLTNEEFSFLIWDAFEGREYDARAQFTSGPRTWQRNGITRIARVFYYDDNTPVIMVSTRNIDFGLVGVNHTLNLTLTVENIGYGDLSLSEIVVINQVFETNFDDLNIDNLDPGESLELTVMFTPGAARDYSGELRIFTNDPNNGMVRVILTGEGTRDIEPDISLSELEHDYGEWRLHYTIEWVLRIYNDGTDNLTIEDIDFDDDVYNSDWDGDPLVIAPRGTHHLIVGFTPDATEEYPGTLTIISDDPDEDELTVSLSGVGVESDDHFIDYGPTDSNQSLLIFEAKLNNEWLCIGDEIAVLDPDDVCAGYVVIGPGDDPSRMRGIRALGDDPGSPRDEGFEEGEELRFLYWDISAGVEIDAIPEFLGGIRLWSPDTFVGLNLSGHRDPLPIISATPMVKNFGEVHANQTYESFITVTNNGETALRVYNIVSSIPRYFDVDFEVGFVLAPEEYRNIAITFQPDDVDDYQAELNITSNGHHQALTVVELRGTGITPPQTIEVSEIEHDFGQVQVDHMGTWELIISNSGWAELVLDRIESDNNAFTTNFPDNPVRLGREEDLLVEVYFIPYQNGFFDGTLTIHSNDDENPTVDIQLSGEGVSYAGIVVDPPDLDFGMILVGDLLAQRFTITNEGNADLHITNIIIDGEGFFVNFDGEITLGPDESQDVPVYFYPDWDDEFNAQVIIESDDEEQGQVTVGLNGESYMPSQDIQLRYAQGEVYVPEFDIHDIVDDFDNAHHALGVDLDRDGDVDILGVADIDDEISWWDNDGEQNFTKFVISNNFDGAGKVHYADIDADGDIDVIGGAHGANQISWWENDGRMNFDEHVLVQNFDALGVYGIDMDDDLDIDILGVDRNNGIYYWENDGNSGFTRRTVVDNFEGCWTAYPVDLDDDNDMDVIAASSNTNQVVWFENDGNQDFSRHTIANNFMDSRSLYPIDIDSDGDWDIVAAAFGDDEVAWFENDGNESFSKHTLLNDFRLANRVTAADLDEDGDVDVTAISFFGNDVVWLENDGSEEFTTHDISPGYSRPTSISTSDIDSDGYLDIITTYNSNKISWFENLYQVEHDFGNYAIHEETTWTFTIANVGQERLRIRTIIPVPDDGIFTTDFEEQATILPGAAIQVVVSFQPDFVDLFEGFLIIESDDPDEDAVIVPLKGEGVPGNQPPFVVSPIDTLTLDEDDFEDLAVAWLDTVFEDPDGDDMTYSAISNDGDFIVRVDENDRLIFDSAEHWYGEVMVTVTADDGYEFRDDPELLGTRQLRIIARNRPEQDENRAFSMADGGNDLDYHERIPGRDFTTDHIISVTVNSVNDPPVWDEVPGDINVEEGDHIVFSVSGSDIENDILEIIDDIPEGAVFTDNNNGNGDFEWQTNNEDEGNYIVTLLLTDRTDTTTASINITVGNVNQPPIWTSLQVEVIGWEEHLLTFTVEATDLDGDPLTIVEHSDDLPEGWEFVDNENGSGTFNWIPGYEDEGNYTLNLTVSDGQIPVPADISIIINNTNRPPEWIDPPDTVRVNEEEELLFSVEAIDPDGGVPGLSAASDDLPDGWGFTNNDDGTGEFRWTPTYDDSGEYILTLAASDNEDITETDVVVIVNNVNREPYFVDPPEIVDGKEGEELVFIFEAVDPDGDDVSIWISSENPPEGIQFTDHGDGTATLVWTPGWEDEGDYNLTVSAADYEYEVDADFIISIARGNREQFWVDIPDSVEVNEGEELSFIVEADDLDGDDLSLWVSSDELPEGWNFTDYGDNTGEFVWTPGFDDSGQYTATFTTYDRIEWYVEEDVVFTVHHVNREPYWDYIPDAEQAAEGAEISFTVRGLDPDSDDLTIEARSDDLPNGWQFTDYQDGTGVFSWQTDYDDEGNYTAYFTLSDGEYPIEEDVLIAVGNTNLPPFWVFIPDTINAAEPELIEVTLIAEDPDGDQVFISFEEEGWPDEVSLTDHDDGTATFYWQTDYNSAGEYLAAFSVTDGDLPISADVPVIVANTNRPPDWDDYPEHVYAEEDELIQFTVQGSDLDGDPLSIDYESGDIPDADFFDNNDGSGDFSWQTSALDEGDYIATFTLFDGEDYVPVDVPITVSHVDHAPTWDDIPVRVEVDEDEIVQFSFAGSDLDDDQLSITVTSDNLPDGDWGYVDNGDGTGSFTWQTTFEDAGEYSADFSLTDDQFIADTSVIIVVYNVNRQPEWYCVPAEPEGRENEELQFTIFTSDPDGDDVSFEITDELPEGMNVQDNGDDSHTLSWTPGYDDAGDYRLDFDVSDNQLTTPGSVSFSIINVNRPPVWDDTPVQVEVLETEEAIFSVSGSDPDGDFLRILTFSDDLPNGWSFSDNGNGTGDFSWETGYDDSGDYTLTLTITDGVDSASADVSIVINNYNPEPVWDNLPLQRTVDEGDLFSFTVQASDPAGEDDLVITWYSDNLPEDIQFTEMDDPDRVLVEWQTDYADSGEYVITFTVSDGEWDIEADLTIVVNDVNPAPVFDVIPEFYIADETEVIQFAIRGHDPDGSAVTISYSSDDLPDVIEFVDNENGTASFTWQTTYEDSGEYTATFSISDGVNVTEQDVPITVRNLNRWPVWDDVPELVEINENDRIEFSVFGSDEDDDLLQIIASSEDLPEDSGWEFTDNGDGSGLFIWQTTYDDSGSYTATFTLTDGFEPVDAEVQIIVINMNRPPEWVDVPSEPIIADENDIIDFIVTGIDLDADDDLTIIYSSDNIPEAADFTDLTDGTASFRWQPTFDDAGNYSATFTLSDGMIQVDTTVQITILNVNRRPIWDYVPEQETVDEEQTLEFTVSASDPDGERVFLTATSLDMPPGWEFVDNDDGTGSFNWTPGYEDSGEYTLSVRASDGDLWVVSDITIRVINVNQAPVWDNIPDYRSVEETEIVQFYFHGYDPDGDAVNLDIDPDNLPDSYEFIDNGDGSGSFLWETTFEDSGTYRPVFLISDNALTTEHTVIIDVGNVNQPPFWTDIPVEVQVREGDLLEFTMSAEDTDEDDLSFSFDEDDVPDDPEDPDNPFLDDRGLGTARFTWTPTYADQGVHDVTFSVSDGIATIDRDVRITVIHVNLPPVWTRVEEFIQFGEGDLVLFSVEGEDPDNDNLTIDYYSGDLPEEEVTFVDHGVGVGTLSWQTEFGDVDEYHATFTISDDQYHVDVDVTISVSDVNRRPVWDVYPNPISAEESDLIQFTIEAYDPDDDPLRIRHIGLPDEAQFIDNEDGTGRFSWQTDYFDAGEYVVTFIVSDGDIDVPLYIDITITGINQRPLWTDIPDAVHADNPGDLIEFDIVGEDIDGDNLDITEVIPQGAEFNETGNGRGSFYWQTNEDDEGVYYASFTLSDWEFDETKQVVITIGDVNQPPEWVEFPDDMIVDEGDLISFTVRGSDPDDDPLRFRHDGLPDEALFTDNLDGTGDFEWQTGPHDSGEYTLTFTLRDGNYHIDRILRIRVNDTNQPPEWTSVPGDIVENEGETVDFFLRGVDNDGDDVTITFDDQGWPDEVTFNDLGDGRAVFAWEPNFNDAGGYTARFTLSDGVFSVDTTVNITIDNVNCEPFYTIEPEPITVLEGEFINFIISGDDIDGDELTIVFDTTGWTDAAQFTNLGSGSGIFAWQTNYNDAGNYTAHFTLSDGEFDVETDVEISVTDVNREPIWIYMPDRFTGYEDSEVEIAVFAVDPDDDELTLDCDSDDLPEGWEFTDEGEGIGFFDWTPGYEDSGQYTATFTVSDGENASSGDVLITINNVNRPPQFTDIPVYVEEYELEIVEFTISGSDPDGENVTLDMIVDDLPDEMQFTDNGDGSGSFYWETTYEDQGEYLITFVISDGNLDTEGDVQVRILNVNREPVWVYVPDEITRDEDESFDFGLVARDPDDDQLTITMQSVDLPEEAVLNDEGDGRARFTWDTDLEDAGTYNPIFYLSDGVAVVETTMTLIVNNVNQAPYWAQIPDTISADEGTMFSLTVVGIDHDGDDLTTSHFSDDIPENADFTDHGDGTGTLLWDITYADAGVYTSLFTISDGVLESTAPVTIIVNNVNNPPYWVDMPDFIGIDEGGLVVFYVEGVDSEGDALEIRYSSIDIPESADFSDFGNGTGVFTWQTNFEDMGRYRALFTLSDGTHDVPAAVIITVGDVNMPPEWVDVPDTVIVTEGNQLDFFVNGSDPDGDALTIYFYSHYLPEEAIFTDNGDGTGNFTWQTGYEDEGVYLATPILSDGEYDVEAEVQIIVLHSNREPEWVVLPEQEIVIDEGDLLQFDVAASDPDGDILRLSMTSPDLPEAAVLTDNGDGTGVFTWQTSYLDGGFYELILVVSDGEDSDEADIFINVGNLNQVPVWTEYPENLTVIGYVENDVSVELTAEDRDGDDLEFFWQWSGERPGDPQVNFEVIDDNRIRFTLNTDRFEFGVYNVTFSVSDGVNEPQLDIAFNIGTDHFIYTETGSSHEIRIDRLVHFGDVLERDEPEIWDEIGVLTPDGVVGGSYRFTDQIDMPLTLMAYGDDPNTQDIEGFAPDESFTFRCWDYDEGVEYGARAELIAGDRNWRHDGFSLIELFIGTGLTVEPGELDFGQLHVQESSSLNLTLRNSGTIPIEGLTCLIDGGNFSVPDLSYDLDVDEEIEIEVTFSPVSDRAYNAVLHIRADFVDLATVELTGTGIETWYYDYTITGIFHNIDVLQADFDGIPVEDYTEIGVMTPAGLCAGAILAAGDAPWEIRVYGDDPETQEIDGFRAGEQFHFAFADTMGGDEIEVEATYLAGPDEWEEDGYSAVILSTGDAHFHPVINERAHHVFIISVDYFGEALNYTDEIAAITPRGDIAGSVMITPDLEIWELDAYGDNPDTRNVVEGFRTGEYIYFRLWDAQSEIEVVVRAEWAEGPNRWDDDAESHVVLTAVSDNNAPIFRPLDDITVTEDEDIDLLLYVLDGDEDPISLSLIGVNLPQGIAFTDLHNGRGLFSWRPNYNQAGQYIALFRAFDGIDETRLEIPIRVTNVNRPPVIAEIDSIEIDEGERLLRLLEAYDPDGDPVSFSIENLPVGASLVGAILRWTPGYDQAGEYDLTIRATDFGQPPLSDEELVHILVIEAQRAPTWDEVDIVRAHESDFVELNLRAVDPDGDELELTAFNLPQGSQFMDLGGGDGVFTWQTGYIHAGYYQPSFVASDGVLADTMIVEIYILNVNRMPILEPIDNQTAYVGSSVEFDVTASDSDDEDNGQLEISTRNAPQGLTLNEWDGSSGSYIWAPDEQGIFPDVRIRVSDSGGGWDEQTIILTALPIDEEPPVITGLNPANEEILRIDRPAIRANITDEGSGIDIVELTLDDQPCEDCTFNPQTGGLVWVSAGELSEGDHNYTVRAVDHAGNQTQINVVFVVNADPGVIEPDDYTIYTLYDRIDLSGTTDPFVDVELWLDGDLTGEAYADYRGRFTFEQVELNEEMNRFIMRGHDNLMAPVRVDVYLDIEPPDIDLVFPIGWISETMPRIRAWIDDEGIGLDVEEGIYLAIDGVQIEGYGFLDGFLTYNIQDPLEEGEHVISIAAVDLLGNTPDDSLDAVIFIDSQAPVVDHPYFTEGMVFISNRSPELIIPINDPIPSSGILGNDLVLSVDGEELDYDWFEIDQSVIFDFDGYDELEAGEHTIIIDVDDRARNNTRATGGFIITDIQDYEAPVISNMFPPHESTAGDGDGGFGIIPARFSADTVAFVISDNDVGVDWDTVWMWVIALNDPGDPADNDTTVYLPGELFQMPHGRMVAVMRNNGDGPQLSPNEMGGLQIGLIQIEAFGDDEVGNQASQLWQFFFDPAAPETPTLVEPNFYYTNDAVISIDGFAGGDEPIYPDDYENLITIRIYRNDDIAAEIYADTFFDFTVPEVLLVEGVNSITATMLDGGGNESEFSDPIELVLDLTSPEITGFETPRGPHISDITPLFSATLRDQGTGIQVADIVFSVDEIEYESIYNPNNGSLIASVMDDLDEGEHTARIDVSDLAGNTTSEEYSFEIHLPPVDPPEFELTPYTSTNRISLTGTSDAGNDIVIIVNDRETGIVETDNANEFNFVYNAPELPEPTWISLMAVSEEEVESEHTEPQMLRHDYAVPLFTGTQPENGTIVAVWELDSVSVHVSDADAGLDSEGFSISLMGEAVMFNSFESDSGYWLSADVADIEFVNNQTVEVIAGANDLAVPPNQGRLRWEFVTQVGASPVLMLPDTSVNEDEQLALNLFAYADDPDHTWQDLNLTAELVEGDEHAQLALDNLGVLRVRAEENWFGRLSIAVEVVDPDEQSGADTMIVDVLPVNDAPVFDEIEDMVVDEGEIVQIWVTATDIDPDDQLTFSTTSNLFNLSPFGVAVFRAVGAMRGVHEIELFVRDEAGATGRTTFELTINSVNSPVEAIGDIPDLVIDEDSEAFTVASLDTIFFDADDDPLFYEVECRGGLIIEIDPESKQVTIEPERNFFGERRVTISADDRNGSTAYAEFWLTVTGINDPPERRGFLPFDISLPEDPGRYVIADLDSVFFDPDGDNIEFDTDGGDSLGVMIDAYGILTLNPMPDWYGVQTFTLKADDGHEPEGGPVRNSGDAEFVDFSNWTMSNGAPSRDDYIPIDIMVEILSENDAPRIIAPIEDQVLYEDDIPRPLLNLFDVFVEVDGDDMEFFVTAEQPLEVRWSDQNGNLLLIAPDNFHGLDLEVVVVAKDPSRLESTDIFMVDILSINDPPQVMNPIADQEFEEDDGPWMVVDLDDVFFDPEGDPFYYRVRAEEPLIVEIDDDHLLTVMAPDNFNGTDIEVTVIASDTPFQITTGSGRVARSTRSIKRDVGPVRQLRSTRSVGRSVGAEHLQPIQFGNRFDDSRPPRRDEEIEEIFKVTITPVNDVPVWTNYPVNVQVAELDSIKFDVIAIDVDMIYGGELLALRIVEENGVIARGAFFTDNGDGTGRFYWLTDYDDAGDFYIVVEARDRADVAVYADISITVNNMNRPLILEHELPDMAFAEDDSFRMDYNLNYHFSDADNDTLVFTVPEHHGIVYLLDEDNHLFLKPEPDWNGETEVVIAATDGFMQVTDTLIVSVESINDLPTAFDLSQPADSVYRYSYPSVQFSWQESIDIVEDSTMTYNLVMYFNDEEHWYRDLPDTTLYVMREDFVINPDEPTEVEWWVWAYDGIDSVRSDGTNIVIIAAIITFRPEKLIIPSEFVLGNAYPNPFNDATRIPYDLPEPSDVVITIYDHTGRLVKTVENRYIYAGRHVAMWDGKDRYGIRSSAGLYFIKLKTDLGVKMSRVMLLR
ncbi:tandem-95 repeat protein [bacterium]|nr:tandem-95 repeat protein [bacterium]